MPESLFGAVFDCHNIAIATMWMMMETIKRDGTAERLTVAVSNMQWELHAASRGL